MTEHNQYLSYRIDVPRDFEEVFTHFYFAGNTTAETITKTLLPSYQTILIFSFGSKAILYSGQDTQIQMEQCLVLGPIKQAFDYALPPDSAILVANFKEDAFYRFFGDAAIAGHVPMDPDELMDENCFTLLWHELNALNEVDKQVSQALEFCRPYLRNRNNLASQLANFGDETLNPIKVIARENKHSERSIQLHHKKYFGYSAKELSRYQRFLKAIRVIQNTASDNKKMDWHEITEACGYYDQSQLIHDFKHYIHLSPAKYLKFQQDICSARS